MYLFIDLFIYFTSVSYLFSFYLFVYVLCYWFHRLYTCFCLCQAVNKTRVISIVMTKEGVRGARRCVMATPAQLLGSVAGIVSGVSARSQGVGKAGIHGHREWSGEGVLPAVRLWAYVVQGGRHPFILTPWQPWEPWWQHEWVASLVFKVAAFCL